MFKYYEKSVVPIEPNCLLNRRQVSAYLKCSYLDCSTLDVRLVFRSPVFCSALRATSFLPPLQRVGKAHVRVVGTMLEP